jgi:glycosyltransferase involved in cell wall biosynthesis
MNPLRILHFVPSFVGGGAERQLSYLALSLVELGHEVHVGFLYGGPNLERLQGTAVQLHRIPAAGNHDPRLVLRARDLIRLVRPDVVQTWLLQMDVFGGAAARLAGIPWILSERCSADMYCEGWKNRIRRALGRRADAIVANSAVGLEYWRGVPNPKGHHVVRNIVRVDEIAATQARPLDQRLFAGSEELVVAAGRLDKQKNWFVLLDAMRAVLSARPAAHAAIFGEGPLEASLRKLIATLDCADRIHMLGYTNDLWQWLKRASLYVSVSRYEGTPNVVLEAIACKCPVVLSDIPSHREILTDDQAEFVPFESDSEIAATMVRVLDAGAESKTKAASAFASLAECSAPAIARRYVQLYREVRQR